MEKELNPQTMQISCEQLTNSYFQTNCWETSNDQNDPFESALSSMVSSPTGASNGGGLILGDGIMMRELIGRLGNISDSSELSCIATCTNNNNNNSANTSCYSTPLNSPPKNSFFMGVTNNFPNYPPSLPHLNADPSFVERAARFSSFGNGRGDLGIKKRSFLDLENGEMGESREGSSLSEQNPVGEIGLKSQNDGNSRKRKSISKAKVKDSPAKNGKVDQQENEKSNVKRSKIDNEEGKKQNAEDSNNNKEKNSNIIKEATIAEPPKDYIHVRARRGQATDSHSLAERVRREKISERMKFLQDLVPGCNKVTGKATVLDEIINYVQSLQHQVEFLSMKLSTFNPRVELNNETLVSKDMFQSRGSEIPQLMCQLEQNSSQAFPLGYQSFQQLPSPLANALLNPSIQLPTMGGFGDLITQMPNFWEDDLQSLVQMGIAHNQTQSVVGTLQNGQMKVEQ